MSFFLGSEVTDGCVMDTRRRLTTRSGRRSAVHLQEGVQGVLSSLSRASQLIAGVRRKPMRKLDGVKKTRSSHLVRALSTVTGTEYTEGERLTIEDIDRWARIVPLKAQQWVDNCLRLAALLAARRAVVSDVAWFWISLYGLLDELGPYFEGHAKLFGEGAVAVAKQIRDIRSLLTEDELWYLDYLRQEMAHPFTHVLRLKIRRPRRRGHPGKVSATYKGRSIQEVESSVRTVMARVNAKYKVRPWDVDKYVALEIAKRLHQPLRALSGAVAVWAAA